MRVGIALPQSSAAAPGHHELTARFAGRAEKLGLDSLWVQEQMLGSDPSLEPIVNLAFVAACTQRIRLGSAAIIVPPRNPVVLAKQLTSVDRLSGGRLIAGLAIGEMPQLYAASGVSPRERGARLDEAVEVIRALWTSTSVHIDDEYRRLEGARMEPQPIQRPHPPIWFGGSSQAALVRAARVGQGWVGAGGSSSRAFAEVAGRLRALLLDRPGFTIAKKVYFAVESTRERAEERIVDWFAAHWGSSRDPNSLAADVAVFGTAAQCAEALESLAEVGDPDLLIVNPVYDEPDQLERLVGEVLPHLREAVSLRNTAQDGEKEELWR
ncbi:LLM class flavin-dependent oxidoreductase [Microbacterium pseudoresistens]|uniref:Putative F420-dependent oxidoreductase n=1 Tax=Microbacterium pseudoresistens TaxID=640634 RepID=A0A7Y9EVC4_9MICO|nr:TIGR03619 family F420-dependent LLM class oxidoreductase [Microbacterium pseudoresistens]NYD54630.1 putative F420-dependent oxidoreductase [Microbacterium pseudoresistens]